MLGKINKNLSYVVQLWRGNYLLPWKSKISTVIYAVLSGYLTGHTGK